MAESNDIQPSPEEFQKWPRLSEAMTAVAAVQGSAAYSSIVQRLSDDMLRAFAARAVLGEGPQLGITRVRPEIWRRIRTYQYLSQHPFWATDDIEIDLVGRLSRQGGARRFYTVRIDPAGLAEMLPQKPTAPDTEKAPVVRSPAPQSAITQRPMNQLR